MLNLNEVKVCIATLNNILVEQKLSLTGDEALMVAAAMNEAQRLCALIDELNEEEKEVE